MSRAPKRPTAAAQKREHYLAQYLREKGISQSQLAREVGRSRPFISQIIARVRTMSGATALELALWSKGELRLDRLLLENRNGVNKVQRRGAA